MFFFKGGKMEGNIECPKLGLSYCTFFNLYIQIPIVSIMKHIILFPIKIIDKTIIIYNDIALL